MFSKFTFYYNTPAHDFLIIYCTFDKYNKFFCLLVYIKSLRPQNVEPDSFTQNPIIFGDFIKIGAERADRVYEELSDMKKLTSVLTDVCWFKASSSCNIA